MSDTLPDYLVTARSLREYTAMFDLPSAALAGRRVLDCPGGAASFAAEAARAGAQVTAVDPAYALAPAELALRALDDARSGGDWVAEHADAYAWETFAGPADHAAERVAAAGRFAWDLRRHPERYVAAALPVLPFDDQAFDLVLSSHLLFTYADRLDVQFHLSAVREMVRVGRELRVFPVVRHADGPVALAEVLAALESAGFCAELRPVAYRLQRSADSMLVVRR